MLSPVAIATWISFCIPWAEPRLTAALIEAGSGGEQYLVTQSTGESFTGKNYAAALRHFRQTKPAGEVYLGLAQVPLSALYRLGLSVEYALDTCGSLEVGYALFLNAYEQARKSEKSPWKTISVAYSYYRTRQLVIDTPFAKKATEILMKGQSVSPLPTGSPLRHQIVAEWSAGLTSRQNSQAKGSSLSLMNESEAISHWARSQF